MDDNRISKKAAAALLTSVFIGAAFCNLFDPFSFARYIIVMIVKILGAM